MRLDVFSLPIFIDEVDLDRIKISDEPFDRVWLSETPSTMGKPHDIPSDTYEYLVEVFIRNLDHLVGANPRFGQIWRNKYEETDWQDIHIHPHSAWSFVIYESVSESRTVFMNPNFRDIQNHWGENLQGFPLDFRPDLKAGNIIIFPSFLQHYVRPGGNGTTIAGNVYMDYN